MNISISNTHNPCLSILTIEDHFIHVEFRQGNAMQELLELGIVKLLEELYSIEGKYNRNNCRIKLRRIFYDNKYSEAYLYMDCLINVGLTLNQPDIDGEINLILDKYSQIRLADKIEHIITNFSLDSFDDNDISYYKNERIDVNNLLQKRY